MKFYTLAVYNLRMCMKGDNPGTKYIKGDNYKYSGQGYTLYFDSQFQCKQLQLTNKRRTFNTYLSNKITQSQNNTPFTVGSLGMTLELFFE